MQHHHFFTPAAALALALAVGNPLYAASHREAPTIATDPTADNTDVYAFVGYDQDNLGRSSENRRVTFILNVNPGQNPSDGPNYFNFADDVLYRLHIDNNTDGRAEDIVYEFRFKTENRPIGGTLSTPLAYVGGTITGGITALDGTGSEGLTRRQTYTVTEVRRGARTRLSFNGQTLIAVPSNAGPATMPDYEALAAQGIYTDETTGIRVFAGQRAETFYVDLGAVFDTLNLRRSPPLLSADEDAANNANPFGVNRFSGANVSTIALEVPITRITRDGKPLTTTANPVIGIYASTSRPRVRRLRTDRPPTHSGPFEQVSRMANPLVNELIINTPSKDLWNTSEPEDEAQFQNFYQNPVVATALFLVYGVPVPDTPRTDLMSVLLKYPGQPLDGTHCGSPCAELLRLDLRVPPTPAERQNRLGAALGSDPAGWPNGRRPNDDVTDIAIRVVGGPNYIGARAGDGVNYLADAPGDPAANDGPGYGSVPGNRLDITTTGSAKEFPFLPTPHDGRNRRHIDCGEPDANPCDSPP